MNLLFRRHLIKIKVIAIMLVVVVVFCTARQWFSTVAYRSLQFLPLPKPVIQIQLKNLQGNNFSQKDFIGKWTLVFFGYSHCPDICPLELQILNRVLQLEKDEPVQALFIGLDPARDSIATLAAYTAQFNRNILAVTGDEKALAKTMRFFGINYNPALQGDTSSSSLQQHSQNNIDTAISSEATENDDVLVHSNRIFLVNLHGEYVGAFPAPQDAEKIAADLQMIIKR